MKHINFEKKVLAIAIGLSTISGSAYAQELEVISVTSQKRTETLADVPVSMQIVNGDLLEEQSIADFKGLVERLPNVNFGTGNGTGTISIRGVGTGTDNASAEQSVGMYVDGMYVSRGYQFNAPFTDTDRIEVLKGPQGVLQGKNSVAGAVVITTRRPTDEFEASIRTGYEFENGGYNIEGMVSGEIADNLYARVVAQKNLAGGWLDINSRYAADGVTMLYGEKDQNEDEFSIFRLSLVWEPTDTLSFFTKVEIGERETRGISYGPTSFQDSAAGDAAQALYEFIDPNFGFIQDGIVSNGFSSEYNPETNQFDITNDPIGVSVDSASFTGQVDWESKLGTVTSITTYSEFDQASNLVLTMAPVDWINFKKEKNNGGEEFDQFTQEIRLVSPGDETFDYIVGAFYMDRTILNDGANELLNLSQSGILPANPAYIYFDAINTRYFNEDTKSISLFGQLTWNISDDFRMNIGARYTDETKEVDHTLSGEFLVPFPEANQAALDLFGTVFFTTDDLPRSEVSDTTLDPSVSMQWDINQNIMLYSSYTKATKAGGFNSSAGNPSNTSFDPETAKGFEVGFKGNFFSNRMFANMAFYSTSYDNLQVSALDGSTNSFFFRNAAEATTQGFEADIRYAITGNLEIGGALAYLDATFDDFPGASCSIGISQEADCDTTSFTRNAKGDKLRFAPKWSGNLYANYTYDLSSNLILNLRADVIYSDEYYWGSQNDPYMMQDAYTKLDFSASVENADGNWKVSLIGKNLTDETTANFGGDALLFDAYWSNVDAPRQIYLTAEYKWF